MPHTPNHPLNRRRCAGLILAVSIVVAALGCGGEKFQDKPVIRETGSPKVNFHEPAIGVLPKPEGPYVFVKALKPSEIQIAGMEGKKETIKLIGLSDVAYPEPVATEQGKPPAKEDPAVEARRQDAIRAFKMEELKKLCTDKQFWLIRMTKATAQDPAKGYLLIPDKLQTSVEPLKGEATLLNALALRNGVANLDLGIVSHPLFDMMLESQLANIVESRRNTNPALANDLWNQFKMVMPEGPHSKLLPDVEKRM